MSHTLKKLLAAMPTPAAVAAVAAVLHIAARPIPIRAAGNIPKREANDCRWPGWAVIVRIIVDPRAFHIALLHIPGFRIAWFHIALLHIPGLHIAWLRIPLLYIPGLNAVARLHNHSARCEFI